MIGCLRTRVRKQPIIALYFESENELKLYNLEARFLPASPNVTSFVDSAMIVFGTKFFMGSPVLADIPTQIFDGL